MQKRQVNFGAFEVEQMRDLEPVKKEKSKQRHSFDFLQVGPVDFSDDFFVKPTQSSNQTNFSPQSNELQISSLGSSQIFDAPLKEPDWHLQAAFPLAKQAEWKNQHIPNLPSQPVQGIHNKAPVAPTGAPLSFEEFKAMMQAGRAKATPVQKNEGTEEKQKKKRLTKKEKEALRLAELERKRVFRKKLIERGIAGLIVLGVFILPLLIAMFFNSTVFVAKNIRIEGVGRYTHQDVLTLLEIRYNQSLSTINIQKIQRKIDATSDLELMKLSFIYPDSIYIKLREKTAVSRVVSNGYYYYLDEYGDVIRKELKRDESIHYIELKNLIMHNSVFSNKPEIKRPEQKEIYIKVMNAIVKLGYQEEIKEMSILSNKDIQITTRDGFTLSVASQGDIAQMIYNAFATKKMQLQLQRQNSNPIGGLITVSNVFNAVYSNEDETHKVNYVPTYVLNPSPSSVYGKDQTEAQDLLQNQTRESTETSPIEDINEGDGELSQIGIEALEENMENTADSQP